MHSITAIPLPCLAALEEGDLAQLPSPVYARGYVRSYAEAVRLDGDRLALELWRTLEQPRVSVPNGVRRPSGPADAAAPQSAPPRPGGPPRKAPSKRAGREPSSLAPLRQPISPFVPKESRVRIPKPPRIGRPKAGRLNLKPERRKRVPSGLRKIAPALERTAIVVLVIVLAAGLLALLRGTPSNDTKTATTATTARPAKARQTKTADAPTRAPTPSAAPTPPAPPPVIAAASDNGTQATYVLGRDHFTVAVAATDAPLWIQVRAGQGGPQLFMGTLEAGQSMPFDAPGAFWVRLGNLAHTAVTVDGVAVTLPAKPAIPYNLFLQR